MKPSEQDQQKIDDPLGAAAKKRLDASIEDMHWKTGSGYYERRAAIWGAPDDGGDQPAIPDP